MAKVYNKLVRDNIIDIIQKDGRKADYEVLNDARYSKALEKKLGEEYKEYIDDPCIEEMCDIIEVIDAICKVKGYTIDVFFDSHEEALNFGRQTKTVKIYKTVSE